MQKDISPEEKTLSTAKESQGKSDGVGVLGFAAKLIRTIDYHILTALKSDFFKSGAFDPQALKTFNRYMVITVSVIAVYFMIDILFVSPSRKAASTIAGISASGAAAPMTERVTPIDTKTYSYYSNRIGGKNIFGAGAFVQSESPADTDEVASENVGLVGIVAGNNPQAIIEDKKSQKTYYITKGQTVNGITVEEIGEDTVLLEYKGRKVTLLL